MKRQIELALILLFAFTTAYSVNASQQDTLPVSTVETEQEVNSGLIYPLGEQGPVTDYFTGTTYLSSLVPNDDIYNVCIP